MIHLVLHALLLTPEPLSVSKAAAAADCLNTLTQEPSQSTRCSLEGCIFFADALSPLEPISLIVPQQQHLRFLPLVAVKHLMAENLQVDAMFSVLCSCLGRETF